MPNEKPKNEIIVADSNEVVEDANTVYYDETHEGVSGAGLAGAGRPTSFKLDHRKGHFFPVDDEDEKYPYLDLVIIRARMYYRKFGERGLACSSDNGKFGYDNDKKGQVECEKCPFFYGLTDFKGDGKCSLGLTVQGLADIDKKVIPVQFNFSQSTARSFAPFLKKLERKQQVLRNVTVRLGSRHVASSTPYYAGEFKVISDKAFVDISPYLPKKGGAREGDEG